MAVIEAGLRPAPVLAANPRIEDLDAQTTKLREDLEDAQKKLQLADGTREDLESENRRLRSELEAARAQPAAAATNDAAKLEKAKAEIVRLERNERMTLDLVPGMDDKELDRLVKEVIMAATVGAPPEVNHKGHAKFLRRAMTPGQLTKIALEWIQLIKDNDTTIESLSEFKLYDLIDGCYNRSDENKALYAQGVSGGGLQRLKKYLDDLAKRQAAQGGRRRR